MLFAVLLLGILAVCIASVIVCACKVKVQDDAYMHWNETDWHIDRLAKPTYIVRLINAVGCGCGPACFSSAMLPIIDALAVQPALKQSLDLMKAADETNINDGVGVIPPILCDAQARQDMKDRVAEYYEDIKASKTITTMSRIILYSAAAHCLGNHYGLLKKAMDNREGLSKEDVREPVFIVSLPRTGTTILHRTMALDKKRFRNFDLADMILPLRSVPRWDEEGRSQLADDANEMLEQLKALYPGWAECLETMHGFRPNEADEDLGWYDNGIGHLYFDVLMKLWPEQRAKEGGISPLESKQMAKYRFAWLKLIMRLHQHIDKEKWEEKLKKDKEAIGENEPLLSSSLSSSEECPTANLPWLMKDPNHSAYLPELIDEFPDAKLVFSHRDPGEIVASMAKLFLIFNTIECVPGAPGSTSQEIGLEGLRRIHHFCNGMISFTKDQGIGGELSLETSKNRKEQTNSPKNSSKRRIISFKRGDSKEETSTPAPPTTSSTRRIDCYFKDIVTDVPGTIEKIYKQFYPKDPTPSVEAMEVMRVYLKENEREKKGNQRRSLEDFHLSPDDVAFNEYNELFLKQMDSVV